VASSVEREPAVARARPSPPAVSVIRTSATSARVRGAAPRVLWLTLVALLALGGLRQLLLPPRPLVLQRDVPAPAAADPAPVDALAQAFARAYLSFDAAQLQAHDDALTAFMSPGVDLSGAVQPGADQSQQVTWTAVSSHAPGPGDSTLVTVAVALAGDPVLRYLAVPVSQGPGGAVAVTGEPGLVAPPAHDERQPPSTGDDVEDGALRSVLVRALRAYLDGDADELAADLLPGSQAAVPQAPLALEQTESITWASRDEIEVDVLARDGRGADYALRYLVSVALRDRWYVAAIYPTGGPP
jgi:hypothetical protein